MAKSLQQGGQVIKIPPPGQTCLLSPMHRLLRPMKRNSATERGSVQIAHRKFYDMNIKSKLNGNWDCLVS